MSNRSGTHYAAPTDADRNKVILGVSTADGVTPLPMEIDPNTGQVQVAASFSAASIAINDGTTTSRKASVLSLTDSKPLATAIVDGNGDQITSFGGGTQYTDGGTPPTHPVGTMPIYNNGGAWQQIDTTHGLPVQVIGTPTVTANAGTNLNTSLLALESGGNLATLAGTVSSSKVNVNISSGNITNFALETGGNLATLVTNTTNIPNVIGTAGSAIPSKLLQIGGSDGTNARAIKVNSSGQLDIRPLTSSDNVTVANSTLAVTQSGTWNVGSSSATGSAVPANAFYVGINGASGNLTGLVGASTVSDGNAGGAYPMVGNAVFGASWDRMREVVNATNSTGTGITAVGNLAQFDDSSPTSITENQFGNLRISQNRNLYTTLRDAAGNERGANVNSSNQLSVSVDGTNAVTQSTSPWIVAGGGTAGSAATGVVTVQGIASMTKLLVTPDANSSVNVSQVGGNSIATDVGATSSGTQRVVVANNTGRSLLSASGSASSSGNNTLVAAGTNKLKVYAFTLSTTSTTSVTCIFQSGASGTELWRVVLQAPTSVSTGANLVVQPPAWLFATASATLLNLNLSAAQTVHWSVSYWDEA